MSSTLIDNFLRLNLTGYGQLHQLVLTSDESNRKPFATWGSHGVTDAIEIRYGENIENGIKNLVESHLAWSRALTYGFQIRLN